MPSSVFKMSLQISLLHLLLYYLMVVGAFGQNWSVKYSRTQICALKGSTVFMYSDYKYPSHLEVVKKFWAKNPAKNVEPTDLTKDPRYSGRTEYYEGEKQLFSLKLINVTERDEHMYCLRITTKREKQKYLYYPGVTLNVTGLRVESPEHVSEGNTTRLTCKTTCTLTDRPTYIWYKNGHRIGTNDEENNTLSLQPTRIEDTGSYSCAVKGYEHLPSPAVPLSVRWAPKNITVSISPSGKIVEGSSVTLNCSSDANPPVKIYTWLKGSTSVGEGKTYSIPNIRSEDSGEYTCHCRNDHGQRRSTAVQINVAYAPKGVSVSISPSGEIVEGSLVTLTCSSDANPPVKNYTWFKGSTSVGEGKTYSISNIRSEDSGEYTCQSRNEHGERNSTAVQLNVLYPPKNITVSISPSGEIVEGSSVTLTCSSDAKPPVKIYTWFKGLASIGNGKTYSIPNSRYEDSGEYTCQSRNEHGERRSTAVQLNVAYPPKNITVSISPSSEIVEGSSVTLTCSSDANPPVKNYTWFKGSTSVGEGKTYRIPNIRSEDSGEYTCQSRNEHGERRSTAVHINVAYAPKNVSVSISPSSEIAEGSLVTLTCSSDANPPVKNYAWFKGSTSVGEGKTYSIPNIRSEDSGEYTCQSRNDHGERRSTAVQLNVLYPPENVSVSIRPSGEIVEGSSVTLTCSSDANPPVKIYTWFKEGGTSPVGSGQNYSFSLNPRSGGFYYCEVLNEYGFIRSASVPVVLNAGHPLSLYVTVFVGFCGVVALLVTGFFLRSKRQNQNRKTDNHDFQNADPKDDTYTALDLTTMTNDNVYEFLGNVHPSPPVDTSKSGCSYYENVATLKSTMNTDQH
ncbi:B-cell receptor CD22-like [Colossoma macropomum]|uniref:B-cell receptor CD22-like n=1 Tax=Colossoma macropomum TaxID=42526 RepID=UPI001864C7EE|nr:B-cell receptor CD22-like [Colossoma macropomum]